MVDEEEVGLSEAIKAQSRIQYELEELYNTLIDPNQRTAKELVQFVEDQAAEYMTNEYPELEYQFKRDFKYSRRKNFEDARGTDLLAIGDALAEASCGVSTEVSARNEIIGELMEMRWTAIRCGKDVRPEKEKLWCTRYRHFLHA